MMLAVMFYIWCEESVRGGDDGADCDVGSAGHVLFMMCSDKCAT
jgi:hypothetical protein